ncbi:MAG: radical SAM protein [Lachnospiraceae bacterium]|nr:radical SAM protein [Lachnospiraceae bacterium]
MYEDLKDLEKKFEIRDFPLNIAIEPSNYCNLNCVMCAHDKLTRKKGAMDIRLYKKIVDEIAKENPYTRVWLDFYGEPLLAKFRLYYMIDYAVKQGLKNLCFNTNATLLDKEMAEMLLDSGVHFISIDCDGFSAEVYEKIRVGAKRDDMYRNTEYLLQRKKERGLTSPIIEVKAMEMDENKHEIDQILSYWRERGAWTCIRRLISWGGRYDNHADGNAQERIACGSGIGILPITWEGIAVNCVMDVDATYPSGDVNKESIKEIWMRRNEYLVKKQMEHKWDELPEICKTCNDWMVVGEIRYDETGKLLEKSYEAEAEMLSN